MDPTIVSPTLKVPVTLPSSSTLVFVFQVLTLALVPLVEPVTSSLNTNVPISEDPGSSIVMVGASVYPIPVSVM